MSEQAEPLLLRMRKINKWYGKGKTRHHVLKDVGLEIRQGEFLSLIGTSGSGKTTLLNIIGGLDSRFEGEVEMRGENIQKLNDKRLSRLRNETLGFIFQAFNLLPHMTCVENVMLPAHFGSHLKDGGEERAKKLLEMVGLGDKVDDHPTELSGGQKQRVAIARALYNRPRIILCDEPTGSLDSETGRQILALFRKLNKEEQLTFVIVTHDENISRNCDRIVRIEDGHIIRDEANVPQDNLLVGGRDGDAAPERLPVPSLVPPPTKSGSLSFDAQFPGAAQADEVMDSSPVLEGDLNVEISAEHLVWRPRASAVEDIEGADADAEETDAVQRAWLLGERRIDLKRPFHCSLSHSRDEAEQHWLHLTVRQQSESTGWQSVGLSAATSTETSVLEEIPEKPERYPLTDEHSLRRTLALLRGAMHRQGRERWL